MKGTVLALLAAAATTVVCSHSIAAEKMLTGAEIKSALSNARVYYRFERWDGLTDYKANGEMSGTIGNRSDTGRWWVEGDKYCRKWSRWSNGAKRCAKISIAGDKATFHFDNGDVFHGSVPKK